MLGNMETRRGMRWGTTALVCLLMALALSLGCGRRDVQLQGAKRQFGLSVVAPVKAGGSDFRSWWFRYTAMPHLIRLAHNEFSHSAYLDHFEQMKIDPAQLKLDKASNVRVYFIGEGSGYVNALGVNLGGTGLHEGTPQLVFPLINQPLQLDVAAQQARSKRWFCWHFLGKPDEANPLLPGDYVDLGRLEAGTSLNFFLGVNDENVYTALPERNPDNMAHMVAVGVEDSPYLLVSFEDMYGGGDSDYEDAVFAVEMSEGNVDALLGRFDPWKMVKRQARRGVVLAFVVGTPLGLVLYRRQARRKRVAKVLAEAEELIGKGRAADAAALLRREKRRTQGKQELRRLTEMEFSASEAARDIAGLCALLPERPELFLERESISLEVGRAQIEMEQLEHYGLLRKGWQDREQAKEAWLVLDSDVMVKEGRPDEALKLLQAAPDAQEPARLARLALLVAADKPVQADAYLAKATALAPRDADVQSLAGMLHETRGRINDAGAAYRAAHALAPHDPLILDRLAEFYRRNGRADAALPLWQKGLMPPSMDFMWTKYLFWTRVLLPGPRELPGFERPPGRLRPLIDFLVELPRDVFWDARKFQVIADYHPYLLARPEVYWLRVLESLRTRHTPEALALLNLEHAGWHSWQPELDTALLWILLYRQSGMMGLVGGTPGGVKQTPKPRHRFLGALHQAAATGGLLPDELTSLLKGDCAFAAACFASGWRAAGMLLLPATLPVDCPQWVREAATGMNSSE